MARNTRTAARQALRALGSKSTEGAIKIMAIANTSSSVNITHVFFDSMGMYVVTDSRTDQVERQGAVILT